MTIPLLFTILLVTLVPIKADDTPPSPTTTVGSPNDQIKCGACPCGTTCYASPPPPVPSPPPPSPPPPPKKQPPTPTVDCPPPPSHGGGGGGGGGGSGSGQAPPNYIYITGPPGDIYPVVQSVSAARRMFAVAPPLLVASGLLFGMIGFW